jgi:malate/lactate dehydrogenase
LPTIVSRSGIEKVLHLDLNEEEQTGLKHSADVRQKTIASVKLA